MGTREALYDRCVTLLQRCAQDRQHLQKQQADLLARYMGQPYGNEVKGRSQVVMSDVADAVEWVMPSMMDIFYGGQEIVEVRPTGPEDEAAALAMQQKLNYDLQQRLPGFTLFHDWIKDALIEKVGAVKYGWARETTTTQKEFRALSPQMWAHVQTLPDFRVETVEERLLSEGPVYDVRGEQTRVQSGPWVEGVPQEDCFFDVQARRVEDCRIVAHRVALSLAEAQRRYGLRAGDLREAYDRFGADALLQERFKDLGGKQFYSRHAGKTEDLQDVFLYECYLRDEDGRPVKALLLGDRLREDKTTSQRPRPDGAYENTYGRPPFCFLTPIRMSHRIVGRALSELAADLQLVRTALARYFLDNIYFQNNAIKVVNPFRIHIEDVREHNYPGGVWRLREDVPVEQAVKFAETAPFPPHFFSIWETTNEIKENRLGVTRYNQGLQARSLNKTASGLSQIMQASQQRIKLIARVFAETGVRDLFQQLVKMNLDYLDYETNIKLSETWLTIKPEDIKGTYDVVVDVGVGTGSKDALFTLILNMLNTFAGLVRSLPELRAILQPKNFYEMFKEAWTLKGYKNVDRFATRPEPGAPQPAPAPGPPVGPVPEAFDPVLAALAEAGGGMEEEEIYG